jgi:predicted HicB family RNase H-like nuclease
MSNEFDMDALGALDQMFGGGNAGAREVKRRRKAEREMSDKRHQKGKGARVQLNVRMKADVKAAITKAAHKAGQPLTDWIEAAVIAYMEKGARHG